MGIREDELPPGPLVEPVLGATGVGGPDSGLAEGTGVSTGTAATFVTSSPAAWAYFRGVARMNDPKPTMVLSSWSGKPALNRIVSPILNPA